MRKTVRYSKTEVKRLKSRRYVEGLKDGYRVGCQHTLRTIVEKILDTKHELIKVPKKK
jgi:hypothetical protein